MRKKNKSDSDFIIVKKSTGELVGDYSPRKKSHTYYLIFYKAFAKNNLMFGLIGEMDQNNIVVVDARLKYNLSRTYNTTERVIQNTFNRIVKAGYALKISRGKYFISPYLFSKTDLVRVESLQAEYNQLQNECKQIGASAPGPELNDENDEIIELDCDGI